MQMGHNFAKFYAAKPLNQYLIIYYFVPTAKMV